MNNNNCGGECSSEVGPVSVQELAEVVAHNATVSHKNTVAFTDALGQMQFLLGFLLQKLDISTDDLQQYAASLEKVEEEKAAEEESEYPKDAFIFGN